MSFLDFLKRKPPEVEILELLEKHLKLCVEATNKLSIALDLKLMENKESEQQIREIKKTEEEADYLRREITGKLAHGILPPISKEDMMQLVKLLDQVIDWTDESARVLRILEVENIPINIRKLLVEQQKICNQCVHALQDTTLTLYHDYDKALDKCNLVEMLEHELDNTYHKLQEALYLSPLSVNDSLLIKQLADNLEEVGDSCENTADLIRVVIVTAFR